MEVLTKICTKCKVDKPLSAEYFPLHNRTKSGFDSWCRSCRSNYRNEIRRGLYRDMISDDDLKDIIDTIKECIICGSQENLVVDHCHKTNIVRGMLCNHCNRGLGHFKDDPQLLEFARIYLISYSENPKEADEYLKKEMLN
jgi:peptide methionine sulfoxide reductase MsrB